MTRWRPISRNRLRELDGPAHYMPATSRHGETPGSPVPGPHGEEPVADGVEVRLAFAPLHKGAFGAAIGATAALLVLALTAFHLILEPGAPNLELLAVYFRGYTVSWRGAFIGAAWAFGVGFVGGWFFAFCRNLAIAISIFITRTKAELGETAEFLDHI